MSSPLIATKLYIPPPRSKVVLRARLNARLNEGLRQDGGFARKLTLISAPAGFGKTTLVSEWCNLQGAQIAWLSLDEADNDPARFLTYFIAALQTIAPGLGQGMLAALQSPQPPTPEAVVTILLNEIAAVPDPFVLVLDDYHRIDAKSIDDALSLILEHLPPQMHLVMTTRQDPDLPLARLRARAQLTELRAADLRFTPAEAAGFLNTVMGLDLQAQDISALETRTEGWIAGLQLAALSLQGQQDNTGFIESFTGSHHFVLDYLVAEVLQQQSETIQAFLLRTSILDRLCGPLCDAVLLAPRGSGQEMLEYLERANLFLVPLDNERRWYRYHHLFADLLRQRLRRHESLTRAAVPSGIAERNLVAEYHIRASEWYEANDLELEAFQHAAAANDVERAERLIEGKGMPLQFRGAGAPVLRWLESLPTHVLDARPSLWVTYASTLLFGGQHTAVESKLKAAEAALRKVELDDKGRDLVGRIASMRATLAVISHHVETIINQSRRALEYLDPNNLSIRAATTWTLGFAYQSEGDRAAARAAYSEIIATKAFEHSIYTIAATINLGQLQEADNDLARAKTSYERVVQLVGEPPQMIACEAFLGLARIAYQRNELELAEQQGERCFQLMQQTESIDTFASYQVFRARLKLAQRDATGAIAALAQAEASVRRNHLTHKLPEIATAQVVTLLSLGNVAAAALLAQTYALPISRARVHLAQKDPSAALAVLESFRRQVETKGWADEQLKAMALQAVAYAAHGEKDRAVRVLSEALGWAEPGGIIRLFIDEGPPMAALLREVAKQGMVSNHVRQVQAAFGPTTDRAPVAQSMLEPLSDRELEVLKLLATELNGPEIADTLGVSLNTMRSHTKNIYTKLGVNSRREAVRRAQELDLL